MKTKKKREKLTWAKFKTFIPLYLMLLPGLIYFFINNYMPMTGIIVAFKKYSKRKGIFGSDWCGRNYYTKYTALQCCFHYPRYGRGRSPGHTDHGCLFPSGQKDLPECNPASVSDFHSHCQLYCICFPQCGKRND